MLPGESGFPILAFALSRESDSVSVGDQCSEIGTAASAAAARVVARRVLLSVPIFHIVLSKPGPSNFV
jgi:hypothetical protein